MLDYFLEDIGCPGKRDRLKLQDLFRLRNLERHEFLSDTSTVFTTVSRGSGYLGGSRPRGLQGLLPMKGHCFLTLSLLHVVGLQWKCTALQSRSPILHCPRTLVRWQAQNQTHNSHTVNTSCLNVAAGDYLKL